jgi:hypothetical protein
MTGDLIRAENARPGTTGWLLDRPAPVTGESRSLPIEGYCSAASVRAGDTLILYVSTDPAADWSVEIYRTGYYGGQGGRLVGRHGPKAGLPQPAPEIGPYRIRACDWQQSLSIRIGDDWLSGVYLGKLTEHHSGYQNYVIFTVKDDRDCDLILKCSDMTWQAYNRWPEFFSVYDDGYDNGMYWGPGVGVSFARPYGRYRNFPDTPLSTGAGEWLLWEFPFAFWAERLGYDISYISGLDLHEGPATLQRTRGLLSVGHDEYYTADMYDHVSASIEQGLNVAFMSGNSVYGKLSPVPHPPRAFVRTDAFSAPDPQMYQIIPSLAYLPYEAPDGRDLMGSRSTYPCMGGGDWTCVLPDHWIFAGTGMKYGDSIPGLVGWETHGLVTQARPVEVVAAGEVTSHWGTGPYAATVYAADRGNVVFNAATIYWYEALSEPPGYQGPEFYQPRNGPDVRVQAITRNILDRFAASPRLRDRCES